MSKACESGYGFKIRQNGLFFGYKNKAMIWCHNPPINEHVKNIDDSTFSESKFHGYGLCCLKTYGYGYYF